MKTFIAIPRFDMIELESVNSETYDFIGREPFIPMKNLVIQLHRRENVPTNLITFSLQFTD